MVPLVTYSLKVIEEELPHRLKVATELCYMIDSHFDVDLVKSLFFSHSAQSVEDLIARFRGQINIIGHSFLYL